MGVDSAVGLLLGNLRLAEELLETLAQLLDDTPDPELDWGVIGVLRERTETVRVHLGRATAAFDYARTTRAPRAALCRVALNEGWRIMGMRLQTRETIEDLEALRRAGDARWRAWCDLATERLSLCDEAMHQTSRAMASCWTEFSVGRKRETGGEGSQGAGDL
jgi:hypothetical protein